MVYSVIVNNLRPRLLWQAVSVSIYSHTKVDRLWVILYLGKHQVLMKLLHKWNRNLMMFFLIHGAAVPPFSSHIQQACVYQILCHFQTPASWSQAGVSYILDSAETVRGTSITNNAEKRQEELPWRDSVIVPVSYYLNSVEPEI